MDTAYYGENAYDSSAVKPRHHPGNIKFRTTVQRLRKHPLRSFATAHCSEFLSVDDIEVIELLSSEETAVLNDIASAGHEFRQWETLSNPKTAIDVITQIMLFFAFVSWVLFFIALLFGLFNWPGIQKFFLFFLKSYILQYTQPGALASMESLACFCSFPINGGNTIEMPN